MRSNNNYLTLHIGGEDRGLKFNLRTIDFIGKLTGTDPLSYGVASANNWESLREFVAVIIHAALLSNYASMKVQTDITKEQMTEWMQELQPSDVYLVMNIYREFMNPDVGSVNGEVDKDTRGNAAVVAAV